MPVTRMEEKPASPLLRTKGDAIEFTVTDTNICKGIAVIFMVLHHAVGLYYDRVAPEWYWQNADSIPQMIFLFFSTAGKVCVSMLTFLSGYGISKSYQKSVNKNPLRFTCSHLLQFYSIFWPLYMLLYTFDHFGIESAGTAFERFFRTFLDVFGLSRLIWANQTGYWFVFAVIVLYCLFPLLNYAEEKIGYWLIPLSAVFVFFCIFNRIPKQNNVLCYLPEFVTGICFAKHSLLDKLKRKSVLAENGKLVFLSVLCALICFILRIIFSLTVDYFFAISIIAAAAVIAPKLKMISGVLSVFGKNSANIWLLHNISLILAGKLGLGWGCKWLGALIFTLGVSIVIEKMKELIGYNKLVKKLRKRIEGAA